MKLLFVLKFNGLEILKTFHEYTYSGLTHVTLVAQRSPDTLTLLLFIPAPWSTPEK